jgi:hypothetical protein
MKTLSIKLTLMLVTFTALYSSLFAQQLTIKGETSPCLNSTYEYELDDTWSCSGGYSWRVAGGLIVTSLTGKKVSIQ